MTLLSALGGGLWIIPLILAILAGYSWWKAVKASQSGSRYQDSRTGKWVESDENLPIYKTGGPFWFAVILTFSAIGSLLWMISDR